MRSQVWAFVSAAALMSVCATGAHAASPIVTGTDQSAAGPKVKSFDGQTLAQQADFFAYIPSFSGGVRVAAGDVNGDGHHDVVVGSGPGGATHVKVVDGTRQGQVGPSGQIADSALLASFFAFDTTFTGGVFVAAGDVTGNFRTDIVTGAGSGSPQVKVVDATRMGMVGPDGVISDSALAARFLAYSPSFTGGVRVAVGDVNGDGHHDVIVGTGPGGPAHVKVIDGTRLGQVDPSGQIADSALLASFFAYDTTFTGGVFVAAGDVTGDGLADLITGTDGGAPGGHVKVFDAVTGAEVRSFLAYPGFTGGVRVGAGDVNGDGIADIITANGPLAPGTPGGGGHIKVFDGVTNAELHSFLAYGAAYIDGTFVAGETVIPEPATAALLNILTAIALAARSPRTRRAFDFRRIT